MTVWRAPLILVTIPIFFQVGLLGCSEERHPTAITLQSPDAPSLSIAHGGAHGSNPHFHFLPPIESARNFQGAFDPTVLDDLTVSVLEWDSDVCTSTEVARFTSDGLGAAERVRVQGNHFAVNWDVRNINLKHDGKYRLRVLFREIELGYADIVLVRDRRALRKNASDGEVALVPNQTLALRFRVEHGAIPSTPMRWESVASMPIALRGATATSDGVCIYAFGGATMNRGGGWVDLTQRYDPSTDRWRMLAPFSPARDWAMTAVLSDGIHLLGGSRGGGSGEPSNVLIDDHQVYDQATNSWTPRAALPIALDAAVAHGVGDLLYVVGGGSPGNNIHGLVQIYDGTTDSWSSGTPMPAPRHTAASAVIDGMIYIAGGEGPGAVTDAHQRYDPTRDAWELLAPVPMAKAGLGGGLILGGGAVDGRFCVFGGIQGFLSAPGTVETFCYDPNADSWEDGPDMMTARGHPAFVTHGNAIYAIGGWTDAGAVTETVERLRR